MNKIAIISSSVREGRLSHRVALFLKQYLENKQLASVEMLDLKSYNFPLFTERLMYQTNPSNELLDFTKKFTDANGIIIVAPVYNGSFPASLKNVIDLYFKEWKHKPIGITSVTYGKVPGIGTVQQIQSIMLKLGALVTPVIHTVIEAREEFSEEGIATNIESAAALAKPMIDELFWLIKKNKE